MFSPDPLQNFSAVVSLRWAIILRDELYKIGLGYIWLNREGEGAVIYKDSQL
jgi:hypothetical protein